MRNAEIFIRFLGNYILNPFTLPCTSFRHEDWFLTRQVAQILKNPVFFSFSRLLARNKTLIIMRVVFLGNAVLKWRVCQDSNGPGQTVDA